MSVNTVGGRQSTVHSVGTSADLPSFDLAIASFKDRIYALDNAELARKVLEGLGRFNTQSVIDPTEGIFIYFEGLDMPEEIIDSLGGLDSYVKGQSAYEAIKSLKIDIRNFTREFMEHVQATFQSYEELFAFAEQLQASGQKEKAVRALYAAAIKVLGEASKDKLTAAVTKIEELDPNMLSLDLQQRINLRAQIAILELSKDLRTVTEKLQNAEAKIRTLEKRVLFLEVAEASRRVYEEKLREIGDGYGFGPENWKKYFGDVGVAPPLPAGIEAILEGPCPFHKGRKVKDTHLLALVPATVNGEPLNFILLEKLMKAPNGGHAFPHDFCMERQTAGLQVQVTSQWTLITRNIIPGTNGKTYSEKMSLLGEQHKVPKLIEVATVVFMHYVRTKERFYYNDEEENDNPDIGGTRCDWEDEHGHSLAFSGVGSDLEDFVFGIYCTEDSSGLGGVWKF
jgi:hypothetical protein